MEEKMMTRKMTSGLVFILVLLLTTIPAWSSTRGPINPAGSGKSLTTDLNTAADYAFKTKIILARGGGGGGNGGGNGGNGGGNGGQGGNGDGYGGGVSGGHGNGVGDGPDADVNGYGGADAAPGPGDGSSGDR
jgi:hypothetical protein